MAVILELGPGETFLFDTPGGTTTINLPEGLKDLEEGVGQGRPIQAIYSLNFGWTGAYILAARTVNGPVIRTQNLPPQLDSWLIDPITHTCKRDIASLTVELGPNGSFYARDKDSYRWHNLPDALEEAIQQQLCPAGWTAKPDFVVLGADGAFIYSNDRGGHRHALGNYPKLQELIFDLQRANVGGLTGLALVQWVSMSIYRPGHFIVLHNSGHHIAELPSDSYQALNSMAGSLPVRNTTPQQPQKRAVSSPIMQQKPSPPIVQQAYPLLTTQTSPSAMIHPTMPIRKPVSPPMASPPMQPPRPQPNHLVSSPIPQAHPARPAPHHLTSAPTPHAQPAARPMSMQAPPVQANVKHRLSSANFKAAGHLASIFNKATGGGHGENNYNNNNSASNSYSNMSNTNNNTYVMGGDSGTAPAPTYLVPGDSGTAPVYGVPGDSGTAPAYTTAGDSGSIVPAGDSGSIGPVGGDSGSSISAGDSGIASTVVNIITASTGSGVLALLHSGLEYLAALI
ncbi:MAG: hypothetical protein ASARMPRED_007101 [Alectoria sarmentosa]|nr:MAG: hypothetical protein ASARMPRED_007101 [Alectoria sarmentosa]